MRDGVSKTRLIPALVLLSALIAGPGLAQSAAQGGEQPSDRSGLGYETPRPGQPGHEQHREWEGKYPTPKTVNDFKVVRSFAPPAGFIGNMAYDRQSGRLWLVSLGPPTNTAGPSMLYELDPKNGKVLAKAEMPFKGDFGQPVFIEGHLYQGVFHESRMYKVSVDRASFGKVVKAIPLPTINDLKLVNEAHSFPFIEFGGVTVTPDNNIMMHADDVGEYITISRETGEILQRARTIKAMGGITGATDDEGRFLVIANSDPRGGYCALSYPPALSRSADQRDISWALTDGRTGDVLASLRTQNSRAYASTIALVKHEEVAESPYGRFTFFATGEEGILEIEWTPGRDAY
jgi:hypothetical protein